MSNNDFALVAVRDPKVVRSTHPRGWDMVYLSALRVRLTGERCDEWFDVVLTARDDTSRDGVWEVSTPEGVFFETVTTGCPTREDVAAMLTRRPEYRADVGRPPGAVGAGTAVPTRWARRRYAGHCAGRSLLTTVVDGTLLEQEVDEYATAVTLGPVRREKLADGSVSAFAELWTLQRSRVDGTVPVPDLTDPWGHQPLDRVRDADAGPWVPERHHLEWSQGRVTLDGQHVLDDPCTPRRSSRSELVRRDMIRAVLRSMPLEVHGPMHAVQVYERLPRVEEFFPEVVRPTARSTGGPSGPLAPVLLVRHENGTVHVRGGARPRVVALLHQCGVETGLFLCDDPESEWFGHPDGVWVEVDSDDEVTSLAALVASDPTLKVLAYVQCYDTRTVGPTVRLRRVDRRDEALERLRPWVHTIDYGEATGFWMMGVERHLKTALACARKEGMDVAVQDSDAAMDALYLPSPDQGRRLEDLLRAQGFVVVSDVFRPCDED